jgi:DNA polymerase-3 subunit gamma/tau
MVTPTLNLAQPSISSAASTKAAAAALPPAATPAPASTPADVPSTTVTLSPQAMSALAAASHPSPPPASSAPSATPAPAPNNSSVYDSLKSGMAIAVADVGDAIEGGAQAVVDGVETVVSTANKAVQGILGLPFAVVAKVCDAAGAVIDAV